MKLTLLRFLDRILWGASEVLDDAAIRMRQRYAHAVREHRARELAKVELTNSKHEADA